MAQLRRRSAVLLVAAIVACSSDPDDGSASSTEGSSTADVSETSSAASSTTNDAPGSSSSSSAGSTSASSSSSTSDAQTSSSSTSGGAESTTTGGGPEIVELINDEFDGGGAVLFQGGFVQDECWASTYVPERDHYPFAIRGIGMVIGGDDMGNAEFEVSIWGVDEENRPSTQLAAGTTTFSGKDDGFDGVSLDVIGIDETVVTEGNFALAVCLVAHDGFPAIGRDAGEMFLEDRNWIFSEGMWVQSADLLLSGNWIMRATIELL